MPSYTRRQLKQDRFVDATKEAVHWSVEHRNTIIVAVTVIAVALAALIGYYAWQSRQEEQASVALGKAVRTYTSSVRPAGEAAQPDDTTRSFATYAERATAAMKEFQQIADQYPRTRNGHYARYMAGISALDKGDAGAAEAELKRAADTGKDAAALANFALANLYASQNKTNDAKQRYRRVVDADARSVPKQQAQLALAALLETAEPTEAVKLYEDIIKEEQAKVKEIQERENRPKTSSPTGSSLPPGLEKTQVQQLAENRIQQLKAAANKK